MGILQMKLHVKLLIFLGCFYLYAEENKLPAYLEYVDEIVDTFSKEMEKEYEIRCCGSGGSMPYNVEKIEVLFSASRKATIEEARKIEINGLKKLLNHVNKHEKIRPYLKEYPFNLERVRVSISFYPSNNGRPLDGSVAHVFFSGKKIFYDKAEVQVDEPTPLIYENEKKEVVKEMIGGGPKERLVPLFEESYEEALKALRLS